jgi:hemolysin D
MNMMSRHWEVAKTALADDRTRIKEIVRSSETAFLPAALEIIERPVSPTARITAWVLLGGLALTLLWATFGQVDVVASAPGRIIPADNVKLVQPVEAGIVRSILVRDGQRVRKGQILIELDPTVSTAETVQAQKALQTAQLDVARARAILSALDGHGLRFVAPAGTSPEMAATQRALAAADYAAIDAASSGRSADLTASRAARSEALTQAAKLTETIPLLDEQLEAYESLLAKGYAAKLKVIELRRQRMAAARDRDAALATANRVTAESSGAGSLVNQNRAEARSRILTDLAKAEAEASLRSEELVKSRQKSSLQRLIAPVDGAVAQLAIHTIGGVVEPAKPIMVIVPWGGTLVADVKIMNRDIGFIREGQLVAVKLEAFPFTRYGTIPGIVSTISSDSFEDQKWGLVYTGRIELAPIRLADKKSTIVVSPGMMATADIQTGRRTILSFLASPIDEIRREAARER